jgi:serine/threonine-protein kinase
MLQLQRFAKPEPVRRYAPETPEQLERVVMQLLAKDPADRFPNTQVLARHLQAMAMALSRPASDDFALAGDHPHNDQAADDAIQSLAIDATHAESDGAKSQNDRDAKDHAVRSATSPASQNAATLAAEEVLAKQASQPLGSSVAPSADSLRQAVLNRPTRFTTVEEEEALHRAQQQRSWLMMAGQLAATAVVLGTIGGIAWHLSRPPSADKLYASVMWRIDSDEGGSLIRVENEVNDFIARYPQDPRTGQFERYKERIELDKLEHKLQRKARGNAALDPSLLPPEQLYLRAAGMADSAPDKALALLESMVNLYGAADSADTSAVQGPAGKKDPGHENVARTADVVQLARRRIETMRADLNRQRERELASLNERLAAAEKLATKDAARAAAIYQAIIDLHQGDSWAESVVAQARSRMAELKK